MEVDGWVALAVTAVTLLSLFVALPRLGFGLLSLLFAWWAGSVVSQWIVVHGPPELVAITREILEVLTCILIGASLVILILRYCCSRRQAHRYLPLDDLIA